MKKIYTWLCALTLIASSSSWAQSSSKQNDYQAYSDYLQLLQDAYDAEEQIGVALEEIEALINDIVAAKKKGIYHESQPELNDFIDMYECLYPFQQGLAYLIEDLELAPDLYAPKYLDEVRQDFETKIEKLASIQECQKLSAMN